MEQMVATNLMVARISASDDSHVASVPVLTGIEATRCDTKVQYQRPKPKVQMHFSQLISPKRHLQMSNSK